MNDSHPQSRPTPAAPATTMPTSLMLDTYVTAVQRAIVRVLARCGGHAAAAADDVAQEVALALLATPGRLAVVMQRYPDPVAYAKARAMHAFTQWERAMRADRGEGARLVARPDGSLRPARAIIAGDAPLPGGDGNHWDLVAARHDPTDDLIEILAGWPEVVRFLDTLDPTDREIVVLVIGFGYQVTEVAARLGIARETAARRLSRIRRRLEAQRGNMVTEMSERHDDKGAA